MSRATPRPCPHDLRPGTTVCLHCRREANLERRARLRGRLFRIATGVSAVAAVGIAIALLGVRRSAAGSIPAIVQQGVATRHPAPAHRTVDLPVATVTQTSTTSTIDTSRRMTPSAVAAVAPVIPQGRHDLSDGLYAERVGDTVLVHFDTPATRTRRPEKFERTVRETLPAVYGAVADSMLAAVPEGTLATGGDLLADLPTHGIRLTAPSGAALTLWPETRPGEDGPLVVTYRVAPAN